MADVSLDLDPAMIDNLRREADEHGFEDVDGYVEWLLGHRDTVLNEHDVWNAPPGGDLDADLGQSSGPSLDPGRSDVGSDTADGPSLEPDSAEPSQDPDGEPAESGADIDLPDEDGADDDDVAAALEELELDDE
ncbi:hypothetical protein [Halapricum hydrolyticum]|uniref:Uncharacterized protein n=1 Tax=Halapricum hydrolyticum TaxID=2979991 RepID=A0AAE3IFR1_9EURY|nr:hypothetical protein [Halapricum hydrolyticum]MCU4718586.1 hypothetical protein [Halapricum hydrolyticum]MCU4727565.1 hypothetical protein [Halapricum hydrolyticum]